MPPPRGGRSCAAEAAAVRFLIRDRDSKFTLAFDDIWRTLGAEVTRTPIQAPNASAVAERWVGTMRQKCVDHLLIARRRQLVRVLHSYLRHYHRHRPPPQPLPVGPRPVSAPRQGGTASRQADPPPRCPRRPDPPIRIRTCSMTPDRSLAPHAPNQRRTAGRAAPPARGFAPARPARPRCSSSPPTCPPPSWHACSASTSVSRWPGNAPAAATGPPTPPISAGAPPPRSTSREGEGDDDAGGQRHAVTGWPATPAGVKLLPCPSSRPPPTCCAPRRRRRCTGSPASSAPAAGSPGCGPSRTAASTPTMPWWSSTATTTGTGSSCAAGPGPAGRSTTPTSPPPGRPPSCASSPARRSPPQRWWQPTPAVRSATPQPCCVRACPAGHQHQPSRVTGAPSSPSSPRRSHRSTRSTVAPSSSCPPTAPTRTCTTSRCRHGLAARGSGSGRFRSPPGRRRRRVAA
jgi:hypothetical protein